ncbi:MAG: hypothetical protein AAGI23_06275 [Bacteroidota bacterium]
MKYFLIVLSICFVQLAQAQLITLVEESTSSKYKDTIPEAGVAIVDINSRIIVKVDIAELEDQMFQYQGVAARDERLTKLRELNRLMRSQNQILNLLNDRFMDGRDAGANLTDYQNLAILVDDVFAEIEENEAILDIIDSEATELRFAREGGNYALLVFDILGEQAQALRESLLDEIAVDGQRDSSLMVYFRLGAFIKNRSGGRPVHIENFDDLTVDQYVEIERFGAPLSQEEEKVLIQNKTLRDSLELNMDNLGGFVASNLKLKADELFPSDTTKLSFRKLYTNTLSLLNRDTETRPAAQVLLENEINLERVNRLYQFATENFENFVNLFSRNQTTSPTSYIESFNQLSQLVANAYQAYHGDVINFGNNDVLLNTNGVVPGFEQLQLVDNSYDNYQQAVQRDISAVQNLIAEVQRLLTPFRKSYIENEELTDAVRRFQAGTIPSEGYIELKGIGERRSGDEILLRGLIERGNDRANANYEYKEIYRRYIGMARVEPHLKMSGSLVLANPYARNMAPARAVQLENNFQFAPSYQIFMKWGSRKNKFVNDFLVPGVGLGFSSPDFNLDGTPEFGAGVTASLFRDIVGFGWAWNFGVDTPYSFISLNVPFTVGGLPGLSSGTGVVVD